jgi:hypothetical protein
MAVKVGTLQVDLIAGTASFTGPLDKAGQQAKKSAQDIQDGFNKVDLTEARGTIALLGEDIGIHLPRHVQAFVAELPGVGAALDAAFPLFAVLALGVALAEGVEKFSKFREEAEKTATDLTNLGTSVNKTFNSLDDKLLQAGIKSDELREDHLAALKKQLELIDRQSMGELASTFDTLAKAADVTFADLKSHWYTFGNGSDGAKHALAEFTTQYDALLAKGDQKGASDLLAGTLQSAQKVLQAQNEIRAGNEGNIRIGQADVLMNIHHLDEAKKALQDANVGTSNDNVKAQETLLDVLNAQLEVETKKAALKKSQTGNITTEASNQRIQQIEKEHQAVQQGLSQQTSATISYYQLQKQEGQMNAEALTALTDQALNKEYQSQRNYLERLKILDARRPEELKNVQAQIEALDAEHKAKLLQNATKLVQEENKHLQEQTQQIIDGAQKQNDAQIKANNAVLDFAKKYDDAALKIFALNTDIANQDAIQSQRMAIATGHLTEQQAVQQTLATLETNRAAEIQKAIAGLNQQFDVMQRLKELTLGGTTGTDDQKLQYQRAVEAWQAMEAQKLEITKKFDAQIDAERLKQANNERSQWNKMFLDFSQLQTHMSQEARQVLGQMNSDIASFVVTGKGNFLQLATSALESFVQMGLQYLESKTVMIAANHLFGSDQDEQTAKTIASNALAATSAAALSAANTLAFTSGIFLPPAPEAFAATAYAAGLSYAGLASAEGGAVLPNREMLVNTHPEEMILPRPISNFIVNAAGRASSGGGNTSHFVFAPTVSAVNADGVDQMLTKHADVFHRHVKKHLRRMHINS